MSGAGRGPDVEHGVDTGPGADSAGLPWSGRTLSGTGFGEDTGEADPLLLAALADPQDEAALVAAVAGARLIVPIVAVPTEVDDSDDLRVEKSTDMAVITLTSPDGHRALPVFSSLEALQAWDPTARPSPVTSALAAQAAVQERCDVLLVDLGTDRQQVLRTSMLWALATNRPWVPAHLDPFVARALSRAVVEEPDVVDCAGEAGEPVGSGTLRVVLRLRPGLDAGAVTLLATRVGERIAADGETRARIDGLTFAIREA